MTGLRLEPVKRCAVLGLLIAGFLPVALGAPLPGVTEGCRRLSLDLRPRWVPQITWSLDFSEVIAIDPAAGRLHRYRPDGIYAGAVARPGLGRLDFSHPTGLTRSGESYVLSDGKGALIWLDRAFQPFKAVDPKADPFEAGVQAVDFGRPLVLVGEKIAIAHFHYQNAEGGWTELFGRFAWNPIRVLEVVDRVADGSPANDLYTLTTNVLTRVGDGIWALRFDEPSYLLRLHPTPMKLSAFPEGFAELPRLPENRGPGTTVLRARALEQATTPFALYGRGDALYLLTRSPRPSGNGVLWQLHGIDPTRDQVTHSVVLPTAAPHIVLAEGPVWWAVLERQRVTGVGRQEISTMLLIPSPWIEDPAAKELQSESLPDCS